MVAVTPLLRIIAARNVRLSGATCIIDDALQALGHKDDAQAKTPASVVLLPATLAAMELGSQHNKALALQYLAIVGRRVVETVGGMLHAMFPRRNPALTQQGFVIKGLLFVLAHNLVLMAQKMLR